MVFLQKGYVQTVLINGRLTEPAVGKRVSEIIIGILKHAITTFVKGIAQQRRGEIDDVSNVLFGQHRCSVKDTFP